MAAFTLSEIEAQIRSLEEAKNTGQLRVTYQDKTVQYRDLTEIQNILNGLYREAAQLSGTRAGARQIRMVTRDGYGR